jgi:hypothetical protein
VVDVGKVLAFIEGDLLGLQDAPECAGAEQSESASRRCFKSFEVSADSCPIRTLLAED